MRMGLLLLVAVVLVRQGTVNLLLGAPPADSAEERGGGGGGEPEGRATAGAMHGAMAVTSVMAVDWRRCHVMAADIAMAGPPACAALLHAAAELLHAMCVYAIHAQACGLRVLLGLRLRCCC